MGSSQQFSLRWNNYLKHITCAFDTLRSDEDLVDVTLSCEGKRIRAHKMLLSACSTYFRDLFKENPCQHPVIIFRNVKFDDLAALVDFMYQGEVNVVQEQLASFLTTAELLAVQGLTDGTGKDSESIAEEDVEIPNEPEVQLQNASGKPMVNNKGNKSPSSPLPYHAVDVSPETPPTKRRKFRDTTSNAEKLSASSSSATKDNDDKTTDHAATAGADPIEIIPLMPNLKLEMPEYLEQDGSSCSYEEQSTGDGSNKLEDTLSNADDDRHLLSKPSTSGERLAQDPAQGGVGRKRKHVGDTTGQVVVQGPGRFSCSLCGSVYKHLASLTQHLEVHRNQTTCILCHTTLSRRTDLRRHMRLKHNMQWQKTIQRHRSPKKGVNS
ncbi:protein abrupt isoform X6 [Diachasma alloeum]|uniref:protein abrupt isoform X6 n=1 Tax=Diachasma alloeum TaxID=454923 RepID=UPI0007384E94|nr:protein abrupt isoform X6 [Diachasma alloeum]